MNKTVKCALTGAAAGVVNGLMGTGGGTAAVPLFTSWVGLEQKKALATTVMTVLPLCLLSAGIYLFRGGFQWGDAWPYLAGGLAGGIAAGLLYGKMSPVWLKRGFGALMALGGARMLLFS
ncbi:MAG: sulfite exporter TauE/SafE family protein [Oscillospiraceae bacterium]|nr:sulfite exporter TauE/SafE family protein [Oscillospiraceae bacterium]